MQSTTEDALFFSLETTYQGSFINGTDQPHAFNFPAIPTGWLNVHRLLEMRMILCGVGFVANILVLLLQLKLKTFKKTQFVFAFTLTATDVIVCPATFMQTYYYRLTILSVPLIYHAINFATSVMSCFVIIAVAFDRYLALCACPLKYKLVVNLRRYTIVIIAMCVFSAGYGYYFSWYFSLDHPSIGLRTFIVSTSLIGITIIIYIFVFFSFARSHEKLSLPKAMKNVRIRQTRRLMLAFGLILGTNIICNLPQPFFGLYIFFQPIGQGYQIYKHIIISNWLYNLQCFNYTLNPIIYWWQVLLRDFSLTLRGSSRRLKTSPSSLPIQEVSTITSKDNLINPTYRQDRLD
ncbi:hypothetical protein HOLleu_10097 [Holothuria leucospilota]|uniref:G-protein coupled receptors family 1 profile domain-containing protein n=1 Tax=Holothuria leucospilota TaxID=206669 RepID=A0A9Q1CEE1_HOLLE|nr:hypothetical protein HOLleu_10097 [Holothuria leucospilota]